MPVDSEVYANELAKKRHGWPLWFPDRPANTEINIGDVGYVDSDGAFVRLFSAVDDNPALNQFGLPSLYTRLEYPPAILQPIKENYLNPQPICSRSVQTTDLGGGAGSDIASTAVSYRFGCSTDQGALLVLRDMAVKQAVQPNKVFEDYMKQHHANWHRFSQSIGLNIDKESIVLVQGWVKTSDWAVAAFVQHGRTHEIDLSSNFGTIASAGAHFVFSAHSAASVAFRTGPKRSERFTPLLPTNSPDDTAVLHDGELLRSATTRLPLNQCVFVLRYKIKYSIWPLIPPKISAGAGSHQLPDPDDSDYADNIMMVESDTPPASPEDPLDVVLDYILERSKSTIEFAITSDEDLITFLDFHNEKPQSLDELKSLLERVSPPIILDKRVGTISMVPQERPVNESSSKVLDPLPRDEDSETSIPDTVPSWELRLFTLLQSLGLLDMRWKEEWKNSTSRQPLWESTVLVNGNELGRGTGSHIFEAREMAAQVTYQQLTGDRPVIGASFNSAFSYTRVC